MRGILEFRGNIPRGIGDRVDIKNIESVSDIGIKEGDVLSIKDVGDFVVILYFEGINNIFINVE
jgi:hypothetical protein